MKYFHSALLTLMLCAAMCVQGMAATHQGNAPDGHGKIQTTRSKVPPLKEMGGTEVDTDFFKLVIPKGWSMPVPVKKMPNDGISVVFASMAQEPAISISTMKTNMPAKEIAEQTIANMKKGGMVISPLEEKDGLWHATISKPARGSLWFGSNGDTAAVTIITGETVERANDIFSILDAKVKGIFPTSAE